MPALTHAPCTHARSLSCAASLSLLLVLLTSAKAHAQQPNIPVRQLGAADAVSKDTIGTPNGMYELSDGRLVVNDFFNRRLIAFDRTLAQFTRLADSANALSASYGKVPTGTIRFSGDSIILVDRIANSLLLLSPSGAVARVMSPPRVSDVALMLGAASMSFQGFPGYAGFDAADRIVYRTSTIPKYALPKVGVPYVPPAMPDSAPLLRADFNRRTADTIAWLKVATRKYTVTHLDGGGVKIKGKVSPLTTEDDWALLSDGTVAIVRARDYHMDWIGADGKLTSTPKMPVDWRRLSDDDKAALIDSTKRVIAKQLEAAIAAAKVGNSAPADALGHSMTLLPVRTSEGDTPQNAAATSSPDPLKGPEVVDADDLPDYVPPIRPGMMRADREGNLWILPMTSTQAGGGLLYDVVNRSGVITQRVRLPAGRVLQAFGADGAVYMTVRDASGMHIERARFAK